MPITIEEEEKFREFLTQIAERRTKLNDWEAGFFADQEKRYKEFGAKLNLSPKQWNVLNKMYERATEV